jgi:hypothetical protein
MRLMKSLVVPVVLLALCACGTAEKNSTVPPEAAGKPVVRYSRGGDAQRRRVIAEAAIGRKDDARKPKVSAAAGTKDAPPSVPVPAEAASEPAAGAAPAVAAARPAEVSSSDEEKKTRVKPPETQKSSAEKTRLLLEYLTGPVPRAQKAYKVLWSIDKKQIPSLVAHVGDNVPTKIRELDLLVLQHDFARYDEESRRWFYLIKGMGSFEIDDIAMNKVTRPKGAVRVRLKSFKGFPLGVVLRAGLLNRFRSTRFPGLDDRKFIVQWWQLFYRQNASNLK